MKLEQRYVVFKVKDAQTLLQPHEIEQLNHLCRVMEARRHNSGKPPLQCLCVEPDWPEYAIALHALETRVDTPAEATPPPMVVVHAAALRDIIEAVTGPGQLVKFMQMTRRESILGNKANAIDTLIEDFNTQVSKWER